MEIHIVQVGPDTEVIEVRSSEYRLVEERIGYLRRAGYPTQKPVLVAGEWVSTVPVTKRVPETVSSEA